MFVTVADMDPGASPASCTVTFKEDQFVMQKPNRNPGKGQAITQRHDLEQPRAKQEKQKCD